jgi:hypothetical protein
VVKHTDARAFKAALLDERSHPASEVANTFSRCGSGPV